MATVEIMSDTLASQVAAGEVVERPASVIKELVENSLDAGARRIVVEIQRGGIALMRVSDDGCGMSPRDAEMSLRRHATSKLRDVGDLAAVTTMGFRGEALPSVASVSRFTLQTRPEGEVEGVELRVEGEKQADPRVSGGPVGTTIEVRDLFFNIPARKKFLKAETTESAHVEHQIRLHALAAPEVGFVFKKDGRITLDLPPAKDFLTRIRALTGPESGRELIKIPKWEGYGVTVTGAVLPPSFARRGRKHQFVFLNNRPVEDTVISRALQEAFRTSLPEGLQPGAWLWLTLDPRLVDVNVHPAKREVRFQDSAKVRKAVFEAVDATLHPPRVEPTPEHEEMPTFEAQKLPRQEVPTARGFPSPAGRSPRENRTSVGAPADRTQNKKLGASAEAWAIATGQELPAADPQKKPREPIAEPEPELTAKPAAPAWQSEVQKELPVDPEPEEKANPAEAFKILGPLGERYMTMQSDEGLVMLDPRCAFERIYYEKLLARDEGIASQGLLVPVLVELEPRDLEAALRYRSFFEDAGFSVEDFGGGTLQVSSVPDFLKLDESRRFLTRLLDDLLAAEGTVRGRSLAYENFVAKVAKRAAEELRWTPSQVPKLLRDLFACDLPYCDPAGKPVLIQLSFQELDRKFGR